MLWSGIGKHHFELSEVLRKLLRCLARSSKHRSRAISRWGRTSELARSSRSWTCCSRSFCSANCVSAFRMLRIRSTYVLVSKQIVTMMRWTDVESSTFEILQRRREYRHEQERVVRSLLRQEQATQSDGDLEEVQFLRVGDQEQNRSFRVQLSAGGCGRGVTLRLSTDRKRQDSLQRPGAKETSAKHR